MFAWDNSQTDGRPADFLLQLLSSQASDSKVAVRKGAVSLLTSFLLILRAARADKALQDSAMRRSTTVLKTLARDSSHTVRKATIDAAAFLAGEAPTDQEVVTAWAHVVFPMMHDAELSVQEAVQAEVCMSSRFGSRCSATHPGVCRLLR